MRDRPGTESSRSEFCRSCDGIGVDGEFMNGIGDISSDWCTFDDAFAPCGLLLLPYALANIGGVGWKSSTGVRTENTAHTVRDDPRTDGLR